MNLRSFLLPLVLLSSLSATAQLPRNEASLSLGMWDSSDLGNEPAVGASFNHYWSSLFSTRFGGFVAKGGDIAATVAHASAELHLFRGGPASPWVGAGGALGSVRQESAELDLVRSDTKLTGIYSGGLDVAVTPRFAIGAEASYMNYEVSLVSRFGDRVDSVTYLLSGRWRF